METLLYEINIRFSDGKHANLHSSISLNEPTKRFEMRKFLSIFLFLSFFQISLAQDFEKVSEAFAKGNASQLGKHMANTVDMTMNGTSSTVGRGDAENKLRTFFMDNEIRDFESVHKGVSKGDVHYMIGQIFTSAGVYRVTVYMHESTSEYVIQSIEIEKD